MNRKKKIDRIDNQITSYQLRTNAYILIFPPAKFEIIEHIKLSTQYIAIRNL